MTPALLISMSRAGSLLTFSAAALIEDRSARSNSIHFKSASGVSSLILLIAARALSSVLQPINTFAPRCANTLAVS